jgi:hypothetical protein
LDHRPDKFGMSWCYNSKGDVMMALRENIKLWNIIARQPLGMAMSVVMPGAVEFLPSTLHEEFLEKFLENY